MTNNPQSKSLDKLILFVGDNPKDINSSEEMAQYVSEYITKVIIGASNA